MYRVSTITGTGKLGSALDVVALFEGVPLVDKGGAESGVVYAAKGFAGELRTRGQAVKPRKRRKQPDAVRFDGQTTLVVKLGSAFVNVKCFRNGVVQMTGMRDEEDGPACMRVVLERLREMPGVATTPEGLGVRDFKVHLINTDFRLPFRVDNNALQRIMMREYQNVSIYERGIYPGVKIVYFYNEGSPAKDGCCHCPSFCQRGAEGAACKRVTVAVFQSGAVIVTGAVDRRQIEEARAFVLRVAERHRAEIQSVDV